VNANKKIPTIERGPLMVDVAGHTLTLNEKKRLLHPLVGGVILFARNFESRAQLCALTRSIHRLRAPQLLIAVDHEGGRVQRFRSDGFTVLPTMRSLGECWMQDPLRAMRMATEVGYVLSAELRACDVDLSFTPVLDLDYGVSSVIGDRAFHRDPRVVAMLARALSQGFGPVPADVWREMSAHMTRPGLDGALTLHYDPAIGVPVRALTEELATAGEAALWSLYDQIQAQTLLIRGQDSDLLTPETAMAMAQRGPRARLETWAGFGHAPTLTSEDQISCVAQFLLAD